jgi:hypothetical protein
VCVCVCVSYYYLIVVIGVVVYLVGSRSLERGGCIHTQEVTPSRVLRLHIRTLYIELKRTVFEVVTSTLCVICSIVVVLLFLLCVLVHPKDKGYGIHMQCLLWYIMIGRILRVVPWDSPLSIRNFCCRVCGRVEYPT